MINYFSKSKQGSTIRLATLAILVFACLAVSSCSSLEKNKITEPKSIAVKNGSGNHVYMVSLREVPVPGRESVRMGQISPVPKGTTQLITRPSSPPPLPKNVIISWIDSTQRQYDREVSLEKVLSNSDAKTTDFLVFEIAASGTVKVYVE